MRDLHWSAKFFLAVGFGVTGLVILMLASEVKDIYDSYYPGFHRQEWLNAKSASNPNPRDRMVLDIIAHRLKKGMSSQAVVTLLGPPEFNNMAGDSALWYQTGWNIITSDYREPLYLTLYFKDKKHLSRTQWKACNSIFTTCEIK